MSTPAAGGAGGGCSGRTSTSFPPSARWRSRSGTRSCRSCATASTPGTFDSPIWVGLDNYRGVIDDPEFRQSLLNNLKLLLAVPVMLGLALAIALVLNDRIRGTRQYQAIVFLPYVLPATAIGIAFSYLLQQNGVLNTALRDVHLGALAQDWLGNSHLAIVSVGGLVVWQQLGFGVVVFTAALLALPPETAEAARIDGAGWWSLQLRVLVPQIRPIIELLTRDPGDHRARVGVQLRVRAHLRRAGLRLERDGAVHLAELLERRERDCGERGGDAARHGERVDLALAVGAAAGGGGMRGAPAGTARRGRGAPCVPPRSSGWRRSTRSGSS